VCDALAPYGVEINTTPVRPEQIVRAVAGRQVGEAFGKDK
jgi:hypothetical protein